MRVKVRRLGLPHQGCQGCILRAHCCSDASHCSCAGAKGQAAMPALAPPVPPALAAPSASACGRASSSSSQEAASHPDMDDTGLASVHVPGSSASIGGSDGAAATRASLILAPPPAVISLKSEAPQLVPQQPSAEQQSPPPSSSGEGELRVVIDSKERLRWSPALHQRFCQAVDSLGGCAVAKVGWDNAEGPGRQLHGHQRRSVPAVERVPQDSLPCSCPPGTERHPPPLSLPHCSPRTLCSVWACRGSRWPMSRGAAGARHGPARVWASWAA